MPNGIPTLFFVWRGTNDTTLWQTQPSNLLGGFPPQAQVPNQPVGTFSKPAILTFGGQLLLAYAQPDGGVVSAFWNYAEPNTNWAYPIGVLGGALTSWAPAMAPFRDGVIMVWPGYGSDTRIWCSLYNTSTNQFNEQYLTVLGPKYNFGSIQSGSTPAIVNWNGTLLMVWRGEGSNDNLYFSFSSDGVNWSDQGQIAGAASTIAPALTIWNGRPFLVFRGGTNDDSIRGTSYNGEQGGTEWVYGDAASLGPFGTSHGPSATIFNGNLFLTWKGASDTDLYWAESSPSNGLTGQNVISNVGSAVGPAVTVF